MSQGLRPIVAIAALAAAGLALPTPVWAHLGSTKFLEVERQDETSVRLDAAVEVVDAAMELGLGEDAATEAVLARAPEIEAWLLGGITLSGADGPCHATPGGLAPTVRDARPYLAFRIDFRCASGPLTLRDDTVFPDDPQHEAFVRVRFADGAGEDARILRRGRQETEIAAPLGAGDVFLTFLVEGGIHLVTGYDHVLFLLALLLAAGLVVKRDGLKAGIKDVMLLVTAFTLGHSVTLATAALGFVVLPSRPVEIVIALSIVCAALLNFVGLRGRRGVPLVAFGFGLIHGFGFSSVLADYGLPRTDQVLALVAFNIGIELAQLAVVVVALIPLARLARLDRYETVVVRGGSVLIAAIAMFWVIERV
jgi:hypothetical protein